MENLRGTFRRYRRGLAGFTKAFCRRRRHREPAIDAGVVNGRRFVRVV
jgi:hypothetical protein